MAVNAILPLTALLLAALIYLLVQYIRHPPRRAASKNDRNDEKASSINKKDQTDPYSEIAPLPSFDWASTEPLKLRPFKKTYHLTMGAYLYPIQANQTGSPKPKPKPH